MVVHVEVADGPSRDEIAERIRSRLSDDLIPSDSEQLFCDYADLAMAKGITVTDSDVHATWVGWMTGRDPDHAALVPFDQLDKSARNADKPYREAIRAVSRKMSGLDSALFPFGEVPQDSVHMLRLYELMVDSSESLVGRRQGVNTFFATINAALLTAIGLVIRSGGEDRVVAAGVLAIGVAGVVFAGAWQSLIESFGQLNTGKFAVIHDMERHMDARIYTAEWEALDRGENPKVYRSFTSREIWVPRAVLAIYFIVIAVCSAIVFGLWTP